MTFVTSLRPAMRDLARALRGEAAPTPAFCDDCQLPAAFRAEIPGTRRRLFVQVHQCLNCAKLICDDG